MAAKVVGATTIIAVDMNDERLALARELGATHTINPGKVDATAEIMAITGYGQFRTRHDGDCKRHPQRGAGAGADGRLRHLGASAMGTEINLDEVHFMSGGRRLMGIVEGESNPDTFIPMLVELYAQGRFPLRQLVKFYNFDEINQAIHDSESARRSSRSCACSRRAEAAPATFHRHFRRNHVESTARFHP